MAGCINESDVEVSLKHALQNASLQDFCGLGRLWPSSCEHSRMVYLLRVGQSANGGQEANREEWYPEQEDIYHERNATTQLL
jgi:hypothetical protein